MVKSTTFNHMDYAGLIVGWAIYFTLHSVLASDKWKSMANRKLGSLFRFHRLVYSAVSTAGLIALFRWSYSMPGEFLTQRTDMLRLPAMLCTTVGVMLIQVSFRQYRLKAFLGFAPEGAGLRRHGILAWIRHPIYSGLILISMGYFLFIPTIPTLICCGCMWIYLPIGIFLEEKKLIKEFGQAYLDYRETVPALVPRWSRLGSHKDQEGQNQDARDTV